MHAGYALWQPFCGGGGFVIAQGFGWLLYAVGFTLSLAWAVAPASVTPAMAVAPRSVLRYDLIIVLSP